MRTWICLLAIGTLLWTCSNTASRKDTVLEGLSLDAERASNVDITYSDSAQLQVRIRGPVMINYLEQSQQRQEFPEGIRVDFYNPSGRVSSVLTAKMATRYDSRGIVILQDSVVWQSAEQQRLETSELIWNEANEKVYNNKFLVATTPRDTIFGKGFTANQNFTDIAIIGTDGRLKVESLE
jgi:LPS export ABC transporter protein LptC